MKKIVKLLSLLICAVFLFSVFPPRQLLAVADVDIYFSLAEPKDGEYPSYDLTEHLYATMPDNMNKSYLRNGIIWYSIDSDGSKHPMIPNVDKFVGGKEYVVRIYFKIDKDYITSVNLNLDPGDFDEASSMYKKQYGVTHYAEFKLVAYKMIKEARVYVDKPVLGEPLSYVYRIPKTVEYHQEIRDIGSPWEKNSMRWEFDDAGNSPLIGDVAIAGMHYAAVIHVFANNGYVFDSDSVLYINDVKIEDASLGYGGATLNGETEYWDPVSPATVHGRISSVNAKIKEPVAGEAPDYEPVLPKDEGYTCKDFNIKWYDVTSGKDVLMNPSKAVFEKGHKYRYDMTLSTTTDSVFDKDNPPEAYVNQKKASAKVKDTDTLIVSGTYEIKKDSNPAPKPTEAGVGGFVERLYTIALGRASDPKGKADWINRVMTQGKTGADIAYGFLYSPEFLNKGLSNEDFLEVLYKVFFDRASDAPGKADWLNRMANGWTKQQVIKGFIDSTEWANVCLRFGIPSGGLGTPSATIEPNEKVIAFATRLYSTCLGRKPDTDGLKNWSLQLANLKVSGTKAAEGFFFSEEFINANHSDDEYIKRLYQTFMGRDYDQAGYDDWMGRLAGGATRKDVFYGFANSKEFGDICAEYGILR